MLALSRKSILAIEAVMDIAHHGRGGPVSSRDFAARLSIPRRQLEPVLQALVRRGILKSIRGPKGGYVLARERRKISLGDIINAAWDRDDEGHRNTQLGATVIGPALDRALDAAMQTLGDTNLSDLMDQANAHGLLADSQSRSDFAI